MFSHAMLDLLGEDVMRKPADEQHRLLFDREYNFGSKVVKSKKQKEQTKDAEREIWRYVKELDNDEERIQ